MTTLKLINALPQNHLGTIRQDAGYCPYCLPEMLEQSSGRLWIPLSWCLTVVRLCIAHGCELLPLKRADRVPPLSKPKRLPLNAEDLWTIRSALAVVEYIADKNQPAAPRDQYVQFLRALREESIDLTDGQFARAIGIDYANSRRTLESGSRPGLQTVFKVAKAVSASPALILTNGAACLSNHSLFERLRVNIGLGGGRQGNLTRNHPPSILDKIRLAFSCAIKGQQELTSFSKFAASCGVSARMLRHQFPRESESYLRLLFLQGAARTQSQTAEARATAYAYVAAHGGAISVKGAVAELMASTGLPKHLLYRELRAAILRG